MSIFLLAIKLFVESKLAITIPIRANSFQSMEISISLMPMSIFLLAIKLFVESKLAITIPIRANSFQSMEISISLMPISIFLLTIVCFLMPIIFIFFRDGYKVLLK